MGWLGWLCIFLLMSPLWVALILYWKTNKDIKKFDQKRDKAEARLTKSLKALCSLLGIEVSYHKALGTAAGRILYHSRAGRLIPDDAKIEILEVYENEPWVLAHELGHYMAIKQREDSSEIGADQEGYKLCCLILNQHEQELLSIPLSAYFGDIRDIK